jgi:hypothetical protein
MNWRGRYEGGGMVVTAKHWWSPKERKAARLAARVLEYKSEHIRKATSGALANALLYGEPGGPGAVLKRYVRE